MITPKAHGPSSLAPLQKTGLKVNSILKWFLPHALIAIALSIQLNALACNELELKPIIEKATNPHTEQGRQFKDAVEDGWSPVRVLFELTPKETHALLDDCRHEVDEYLNKIGYPPAH
jgi:hypothetical protein